MLAVLAVVALVAILRNLWVLDALLQALPAAPDPNADLAQTLHDALLMHSTLGWVLGGVLAVCMIVPLVLKALGKNVPLLDTLISVVVSVAKSFVKPKDAVDVVGTPEQKAAEQAQPGVKAVADVVDINSLADKDKK